MLTVLDSETKAWFLMLITFDLQGLSMRQIRFRFDGQPISETDTPAQVGKTHLLQNILTPVCGSKGFETKMILGLVGALGRGFVAEGTELMESISHVN